MAGPIRPNRAKLQEQRGQFAIREPKIPEEDKKGQRVMDTTAQLETRIDNALARIKGHADAAVALSQKFNDLQAARAQDLAELDDLVAELKPLVEED